MNDSLYRWEAIRAINTFKCINAKLRKVLNVEKSNSNLFLYVEILPVWDDFI